MASGITTIRSSHSVDETVKRLEQLLQTKGIQLFALIDHSGEAEKAGMHMPPTKLLIFGNRRAGPRIPKDQQLGGRHVHARLFRFSAVIDQDEKFYSFGLQD